MFSWEIFLRFPICEKMSIECILNCQVKFRILQTQFCICAVNKKEIKNSAIRAHSKSP